MLFRQPEKGKSARVKINAVSRDRRITLLGSLRARAGHDKITCLLFEKFLPPSGSCSLDKRERRDLAGSTVKGGYVTCLVYGKGGEGSPSTVEEIAAGVCIRAAGDASEVGWEISCQY